MRGDRQTYRLGRDFGQDRPRRRHLLGAFPWTLLLYGAAAWVGKPKPVASPSIVDDIRTLRSGSARDYRSTMRDIDIRLAEVETYVTASNSRLSREIEELR